MLPVITNAPRSPRGGATSPPSSTPASPQLPSSPPLPLDRATASVVLHHALTEPYFYDIRQYPNERPINDDNDDDADDNVTSYMTTTPQVPALSTVHSKHMIGRKATERKFVEITRTVLTNEGVSTMAVERLHTVLLVYSSGFHHVMHDVVSELAPAAAANDKHKCIIAHVWQLFVHLLCTSGAPDDGTYQLRIMACDLRGQRQLQRAHRCCERTVASLNRRCAPLSNEIRRLQAAIHDMQSGRRAAEERRRVLESERSQQSVSLTALRERAETLDASAVRWQRKLRVTRAKYHMFCEDERCVRAQLAESDRVLREHEAELVRRQHAYTSACAEEKRAQVTVESLRAQEERKSNDVARLKDETATVAREASEWEAKATDTRAQMTAAVAAVAECEARWQAADRECTLVARDHDQRQLRLRHATTVLQGHVNHREHAHCQVEQLRATIAAQRRAIDEKRAHIAHAEASTIESARVCEETTRETAAVQQRHDDVQREITETEVEWRDVVERRHGLQVAHGERKAEVDDTGVEVQRLEHGVRELNAAIQSCDGRTAKAADAEQRASGELARMVGERTRIEEQHTRDCEPVERDLTRVRHQCRMKAARQFVATRRAHIVARQKAEAVAEHARLQARVEELTTDVWSVKKEQHRVEQQSHALSQEKLRVEHKLRTHAPKIQRCEETMRQLKDEHAACTVAAHSAKREFDTSEAGLRAEVSELEATSTRVWDDKERMEREHERRMEVVTRECFVAEYAVDERLRDARAEYDELMNEHGRVKRTWRVLEAKLPTRRHVNAKLQQKVRGIQDRVQVLNAGTEEMEAAGRVLASEMETMGDELEAGRAEIASMCDEYERVVTTTDQSDAEIMALEDEVAMLERVLGSYSQPDAPKVSLATQTHQHPVHKGVQTPLGMMYGVARE